MSKTERDIKSNKTASEQIYSRLRDMIERGELKPGMRLIQRDLAAQLNTSNIPIVEAIRRLEHDGLVVSSPNRGAQVINWSVDEMESAIIIRSALEQVAARLCAVRATSEQRAKLKDLAGRFKECAMDGDVEGCLKNDANLHALIVKCSGSRQLARMLSNSRVITNTIRNIVWLPARASRPDIHDGLIDAIVAGNEELAEAQARGHLEELLENFRRAMQSRGFPPPR